MPPLPLLLPPLPPLPLLLSPLCSQHSDTVAKMMLMANCHDVAPTRICHKARLPGQEGGTEKCPLQEGAPPQSPAPVALAVKQRNNALACQLIALTVVQLLGVRSLVEFGNTCLFHSVVILREVQRRGGRHCYHQGQGGMVDCLDR